MSSEQRSMATMSALIRTAEWAVDNAAALHRDASRAHAARESEHKSAQTSAEQARQFTLELLGRASFGVDMLSVATTNQALVNNQVERAAQMLGEAERALTDAHQKLTQARITQQLYERLQERKAVLYRQDNDRRAQSELDDAGVTLKMYEKSSAMKLTNQETADGY